MPVRRFVWLLAALVCVFVATLFFRPLAPRELITNPLFAIGFGAPLVLHLSSLPRWKELLATALLGVALSLVIGNWIIGLGLGSTAVLAFRRNWLFLLPSLIALVFTLEVSLFLQLISTVPRLTYDAFLYHADLAYGTAISFRVGQLFAAYPIVGAICTAIYLAPPPGLIYVYALEAKSKQPPRVDIVTTLVLMGAVGYSLYFLLPACGPKFVFPSFPRLPSSPPLALIAAPHAPRNAMPSLHMASALIAYVHARRFGRIASAVALLFVIGTFLGTMGTGEHYFIDLVAAIPFTAMMFLLLARRFVRAIEPALLLFASLVLFRSVLLTPLLAWLLLALSLVCARNLHQNAPHEQF
ncbi:MAG TPA: phosphatase PAP2 family protein [Thermoanaerobaculia bacterium]|nr:phosphatase PAP2 family protein [Thermoanaerobaculia bacterium]